MLRHAIQLVVVAHVLLAFPAQAQEQAQWSVEADARRDAKVVERYQQILLRNPSHTSVYRGLLARLGRGPALDPFIHRVRTVAESGTRAAPWILLGHLERDRGNAGASLAAYQRAAQTEPDSSAPHAALGAALDRAGRSAAADAAYQRALTLAPDDASRRKLLRELADLALARTDHVRALEWLAKLVEMQPRGYALRIELAETQLRAHRFDAALKSFQAAYALAGKNGKRRAETLLDIGNVQRQMHDAVAAERSYRRALSFVGRSSWMRREILMRLVDVARESRTLPAMVDELLREWPSPGYHDTMVLAGLAEELGRDEDAVRWLERAARLDRRAIEPRTRLIARLDHEGDAARVQKLYDELLALRPDDISQRLEQIEWLFFRAQQAEDALAALAELEREVGDDAVSLVEIAASYQRFGLPDAALRIHARLEQVAPEHVLHLEAYGELLTRLGRADDADAIWARLFALDPDDVRARLRVAEIAARLRDFDHAIELLEAVVRDHPQMIDARQRLAGAHEAREQWTAALTHWELLFFEHRVDHAARRVIAIARRAAFIGDDIVTPDAGLLERWETRYSVHPDLRTAVVLVQLRDALGRPKPARSLAREIASRDPAALAIDDHSAWLEAARFVVADVEARDPRGAVALLSRIATAFGDQRTASWRRAVEIAVGSNDGAFVEDVLARALDAVPNDAHIQAVAGVYQGSRGDHERAIEHLRRAVELGPHSFDVHFDLAHHLKEAGQSDAARAVYLDVVRGDATGRWATSAAFSAIDLCRTDTHLRDVADEIAALRGRLPASDFYAIVVATYQELFWYAQDPQAAFAALGDEALPLLVAAMESDADEDRERASELLRSYPPQDVARTALSTWPANAELWSAEMVWALARTRSASAGAPLVGALESEDPDVREIAVFGVGYARVEAAVAPLAKRMELPGLSDDELSLITAALGRIGTRDAVQLLAQIASGGDVETQTLATWALGQAESADATSALAERLTAAPTDVREIAGVMLRRQGDRGLRALLLAAWDRDPMRQAMGRRGLRIALMPDDVWGEYDATPATPHHSIRHAISSALTSPAGEPTALAFVGREAVVVDIARRALDEEQRTLVLEHLIASVDELDDADRQDGADTMRRVVDGLRPKLRQLVRSNDIPTVVSASRLLPVARQPADAELIAHAANTLETADGSRVVEKLATYPWGSVRPTLLSGMRSDQPHRRAAAARALSRNPGARGDDEAATLLEQLADDPDVDVQVAAVEALGALRRDEAATMLAQMYDAAAPNTQRAIRTALSHMDSQVARRAAQQIAIQPSRRVCDGDQENLAELLEDACVGALEISDF